MTDADIADRPPEEPEHDPRLGTEVDRYTIVRLLGKGGMGRVYEARHTRLARRVAIKFLLPELSSRTELLRRFENEAMAAGRLEHPNLVAVTDLGRAADGAPYLVMEFLEGEDCARLLRRSGPLPAVRAANIVVQACRGVAVAHAAGVIHRDIKPENLYLVDAGDGSDLVKVLDFGIAKLRPASGQAATRTGSIFGTTPYMSPEQARGANDVDARTDVWSLGVALFELLTGSKPFDGEQPLNVVHQILNAPAPALDALRPGLPPRLVAAVEKALEKGVDERFATIAAFAAALEPVVGRAATAALRPRAPADLSSTQPTPLTGADERKPLRASRRRAIGIAFAVGASMGILTASVATRGKPAPVLASPTSVAPAAATPPTTAALAIAAPSAKMSGQSGQSGQPERSELAGRPGPSDAPPLRRRPRRGTTAALKLDPNPY